MIYKLKKLSSKYGINIVYERMGTIYGRYVVDYGGNNPRDFNFFIKNPDTRKRAKKEMLKYLKKNEKKS